jgi:hypothetical protein
MALISQMDPRAAGEFLYKKFMAAHEANKGGAAEEHPSRDVQKWVRASATGSTPGSTEKEIEKGEDDQQPELTAGGNSGAGGAVPAQDSGGSWVLGLDGQRRFVPRGGQMLPGDVAINVSRETMSTGESQRAMAKAFPGWNRLK